MLTIFSSFMCTIPPSAVAKCPNPILTDWREHLTKVRRDLGVKRTRFHGLLDDDFSISLGAVF